MLKRPNKCGIWDMFYIPFRVTPFYTLFYAFQSILSALIPTILIFATVSLLNTAIAVLNNEAGRSAITGSIIILSAIMMYNVLIGIVMNIVDTYRNNKVMTVTVPALQVKASSLEYWQREDPYAIDLLLRADAAVEGKVWRVYNAFLGVANLLFFVTGILITLFVQVWWLAVSIVAVSIPLVFIAYKAGKSIYATERELTHTDRMAQYYSSILTEREAVEERNVFGYTEQINKRYGEIFEKARKDRFKVELKYFITAKAGGIITTIYAMGTMAALMTPVINGEISIGMFIALIGAVLALSGRLSWGLNDIVQEVTHNIEYLKDLQEFMDLPEDVDAMSFADKNVIFSKIEFKDVRFKYPRTEKYVLDGVSFIIENGKNYAFVGENGSGKTTIIMLLCRLYTHYEGEILVDGRSLRDLSQSQAKGLVSVVFQFFAKYPISLYNHMLIANLDDPNRKVMEDTLEMVGLSDLVKKLKNGIDTPLGTEKPGGVDISGGEWQRVALARCVLKSAPLRILDEPTAALDPISESRLYRNFERISKGITTIFISHRLGSTKLADVIYVLSGGRITEAGSHKELMAQDKLYRKMFDAQASWYIEDAATPSSGATV